MKKNDVHNEIKGNLALKGWTLTAVVKEMNIRRKRTKQKEISLPNLFNKIRRGTIKYSEVKEIALIIGSEIKW